MPALKIRVDIANKDNYNSGFAKKILESFLEANEGKATRIKKNLNEKLDL